MQITDIRIRLVQKDNSKLKAVASITIDNCFVVHDIKLIDSGEGMFIAMPSRLTNNGEHKDIAHPIKTETREEINRLVITAYENSLDSQTV